MQAAVLIMVQKLHQGALVITQIYGGITKYFIFEGNAR